MFIAVYNRAGQLLRTAQNLIKRQPTHPGQEDSAQKYITFGINDAFPLKLSKSIQDSVTASACLNTVSKFLRGSGFSNYGLDKKIINSSGQTFYDLHCDVSKSFSAFRGFALLVKYSRVGAITEIYHLPFEYCRLGIADKQGFISKIVYNPYFGTSEERYDESIEYDVFNPAIVLNQMIVQQNKFKGQVFWYGETSALSRFYPFPVFASCQNWMMIEAGISLFHKENLDNGFFQSVLLRIVGDPNQPSTHPDDQKWNDTTQKYESNRTVGERFNLEMQKFSGTERVGNVMVQWAGNRDEFPDVQAFPANGNQELFTALSGEATDKIILAFNVPGILANIQKGATLGGDGNSIRVAVKLMHSRIYDDQQILTLAYDKLLSKFYEPYLESVKIINYNPYPELETIDKQIWDALTIPERRKWIKENTKYPIEDIVPPGPNNLMIKNLLWTDYPDKAKKNAATAMNFRDNGCGTKMGWQICQKIIDGFPLSFKDVKRIYKWLDKNSWAKDRLPNEDCEAVQYLAWGGHDMWKWCAERIKSVES